MIACPHCCRPNPAAALFCFHDGTALGNHSTASLRQRFAAPFVFPTGRAAWTFDELALACLDEWPAAVDLLRTGAISVFLRAAGRADLAERAREVSLFPDIDWGLAQFLDRLPTHNMPDAKLSLPITDIDLGYLRVGQDLTRLLNLENPARGYLHGSITSDSPWLTVSRSRFACTDETSIEILIRGRDLRAALTPLVGRLTVESNGGTAVVTVRATVPPNTFAAGVLAGARTPRQIVEKATAAPQEAARLFESGAVARWYQSNGWTYPVKGDPPPGTSAIGLYFVALGLSAPDIAPPVTATTIPADQEEGLSWLPPSPAGQGAAREVGERERSVSRLLASDPYRGTDVPRSPDTVEAPTNDAPDWQPITRSRRPPRPPAPPIRLTPVERPRSRVWLLLLLLPLALMMMIGLAGVGVALSLPSKPAAERTALETETQPPQNTPPPVQKKRPSPPPAVPPRLDVKVIRPRPLPPPVLVVPEFKVPGVEVVFCLDTTGSMKSLLKGVQAKVWSMCNQIVAGKPTPTIKVGLIAYRDKGDDYITQVTPLSADLDAVHQSLLGLMAGGGGDSPEHVNQALHDAVNKIEWSRDKKTLKIIFLVGDAPPHTDYTDDVKYPDTCKKAIEKGIIINAIQCGDEAETAMAWKDIASKARGEFVAIPQTGGVRVVTTPLDDKLTSLLGDLLDTALIYGKKWEKTAGERMLLTARALRGPSGADRAAFAARSKRICPYDLLDAINARRVKLEGVRLEELPAVLAGLKTLAERRALLEKMSAKRAKLQVEIMNVEKKRADHIRETTTLRKDAFDIQVLAILRKQAKAFGVEY